MAHVLENLQREVQEARDAHTSAVALIGGLKTEIQNLVTNATELDELKSALTQMTQELSDSTDTLAAAVAGDQAGGGATDPGTGGGDTAPDPEVPQPFTPGDQGGNGDDADDRP